MSAQKQDLAAKYAGALADYVARKPVKEILENHGISRVTLTRAIKEAGITKRKGTGQGYAARAEPQQLEGEAYDKFRIIPETDCQCGTGCGLTFRKVQGQRSRKFHPKCPAYAERLAEQKRQQTKRAAARRAAVAPPRTKRGGKAPDPTAGRPRVKVCTVCYNLAHARQNPKCPACGLPFEPTPSLPNHSMLKKMPENTEGKWR